MITQTTNLNLIPGTVLPRINVVQYDKSSRTLEFAIFNGNQRFTLTSAMTADIQGTKPDRFGFSYAATVDTVNNIVVADLTQQMTAAKGEAVCEIVLKKGSERIGTLNFIMNIQPAALNDDTVVSDSELPDIIAEATAQMEAAAASATLAESFAKGGTSSRTGEDTDNAKYYKEQAANSATSAGSSASSAEADALKAEGFAVGEQNGTPVTSGSPYYHNNAEYYAQDAAASAASAAAWSSNPPYIGANGDWYVYDTATEQYVDSGVDASITVDIEDITMLPAGSTPYVTNTGTDTDPVFHLFIPKGDTGETGQTGPQGPAATIQVGTVQTGAAGSSATVTNSGTSSAAVFDFSIPQGIQGSTGPTGNGIASITKTGTSGLVDTYTVTYTDGNSDTFTVTNGRDGTGSGDMSKADYDPSDAVYNVGGIPAYVTAQIEGLDVSDTAVAGEYVTAVSEADGEISVTREAADTTPTNGSSKMITSGGAYTALANKANTADLAAVATSGAYSDLSGTPSLATVATSGAYSDLSGTPTLATVATSGAYSDLSGTPTLATVATSGDYDDLLDKPTLGTAAAKNSTNAVTQNSTDLVESGAVYTEVSSLSSALANVEDNLSHVNLLLNPWFTVNQRNATAATAGQFIADRWRFQDASAHTGNNCIISGHDITLKTYNNDGLVQLFDNTYLVDGETYTISAKIDGVIYKKTITFPMTSAAPYDGSDKYFCFVGYVGGGTDYIGIYPYITFNSMEITATVSCVKLEKGNVSTLAMDKEPDYAIELAKCRASISQELDIYANQGQINVGTPNPNLVDNPWFTINQRDFSTATPSSGRPIIVDRWHLQRNMTATLNSDNTLTISNPTNDDSLVLVQYLENLIPFLGKTVTLSMMLSDGTIHQASGVIPSTTTTVVNYSSGDLGLLFVFNPTVDSSYVRIDVKAGKTITIKAVKLEVGTQSTLASDVPPSYETELLKCMRYFQRLKPDNIWGWVGIGNAWTTTTFQGIVPLPAPIKAGATKSSTGNIQWYDGSATKDIGSLTLGQICGTTMQVAGSAASGVTYTQGCGGLICQSGSYIDISAEI